MNSLEGLFKFLPFFRKGKKPIYPVNLVAKNEIRMTRIKIPFTIIFIKKGI